MVALQETTYIDHDVNDKVLSEILVNIFQQFVILELLLDFG